MLCNEMVVLECQGSMIKRQFVQTHHNKTTPEYITVDHVIPHSDPIRASNRNILLTKRTTNTPERSMTVTRIVSKDKTVAQDSFLPESNNSRLHTSQTLHIATYRNMDEMNSGQ